MRVLVTGAAGFVGSHTAEALLSRGHHVDALVRGPVPSGRLSGMAGDLDIHAVDLTDVPALQRTVDSIRPDAVVHLAWYAKPGRYLLDVARNLESLAASLALLRVCLDAGVGRMVLGGTCLEGASGGPTSIYASTKSALHDVALSEGVQAQTAVACAHIFSPFGPGESPDRAVPSVIRSLLRGELVAVTSGSQWRDYLHVADVASALAVLVEARFRGYADVCSGHPRQLREVFETIDAEIGSPALVQWGHIQAGDHETFDVTGDPYVLLELGWKARFDLRQGISDAVAWWRSELATTRGRQ